MSVIDFDNTTVRFPGGRVASFAAPTPLRLIADQPELQPRPGSGPLMAIRVNGLVMSINKKLNAHDNEVEPVFFDSVEGRSIYRRSLVFVMMMASSSALGRDRVVTMDHSVKKGVYLVTVNKGQSEVTHDEVRALKERMRAIVDANHAITERIIGYDEALRHFERHAMPYSHALVETSNSDKIRVFHCEGHMAPFMRCMCPTTGLLSSFNLVPALGGRGFALIFPGPYPGMPMPEIAGPEFVESPMLAEVHREYHEWGRVLGAECVGHVNQHILANEGKDFVAMSEALHNQKVVEISLRLNQLRDKLKLVLIAGPSASGKTTFAAKLGMQLRIFGFRPVVLSVDNYYKPRVECPRDENGEYDFEVIDSLRLDTLNDHLARLMQGEEVESPIFDFYTGRPKEQTIKVKLPPNGVLVMEGINTLNPRLTEAVPAENKFKIFLAPLSQLNIDECNFPSHSVDRLIRRINRDYNHRGYSAKETLARWPAVTRSEERNIMPFAHAADVVFNTALLYEKSVLKTYVSPLLKSVKPGSAQYNDARNLLEMLDCFYPIPHDHVPATSLLREFIGGSFFEED
eukprot:m51a1_g11316 putative atpase aaa (573) ;mRNA; r:104071-106023